MNTKTGKPTPQLNIATCMPFLPLPIGACLFICLCLYMCLFVGVGGRLLVVVVGVLFCCCVYVAVCV